MSLVSQIKFCGNNLELLANKFQEQEVKGVYQTAVWLPCEKSVCLMHELHMLAQWNGNSESKKVNSMASTGKTTPIGLKIIVQYFTPYITQCRCYRTCWLPPQGTWAASKLRYFLLKKQYISAKLDGIHAKHNLQHLALTWERLMFSRVREGQGMSSDIIAHKRWQLEIK